jgi:opacity protein-like surface antigen
MKLKKITTSAALAACLLGTLSVNANANPVAYGLKTGYAAGTLASTSVSGPVVDFTVSGNYKNWQGAMNIGATFLNGSNSTSNLGTGNPYLGEINWQLGYQVISKLYVYGLAGVAGINTTSSSNANDTYDGFEWGGGVSYDWMKYMSVYAQYTGQSLSASSGSGSNITGSLFTAGLQFHTALF